MPNGDEFSKRLAEWEKQTQLFQGRVEANQRLLSDYGKRLEQISTIPGGITPEIWEKMPSWVKSTMTTIYRLSFLPMPLRVPPALPEKRQLKSDIDATFAELERNDFFTRLYREVPIAISQGSVSSADEVLAMLRPPPGLSSEELTTVRGTVTDMLMAITRPPAFVEEIEYPELEAPEAIRRVPVGIHQITLQAIISALKAPRVPESAMTQEEWNAYLKLEGYTDEDIDKQLQLEAEELITSWADRNNQIEAYQAGLAEMPEYKAIDVLKEMAIQPGLALGELAMKYFEHVSMPLAGALYKNFIPDIEADYQRFKAANPDASQQEALTYAWKAWEGAPGPWVLDWVLKYMLMEGAVDPLTYVGWGIVSRFIKPGSRLYGLVRLDRGIGDVLELPFDAVKALTRRVPKTLTQRATMAQHQTSQLVRRYMTKYTGKPLSRIGMRDFATGADDAIKYALKHPELEDPMALAGREMLRHSPIDEAATKRWADNLGTTLAPDEITKDTVGAVNQIFEDFFWQAEPKLLTANEAASQILKVFHNAGDDKVLPAARALLETRAAQIQRGALAFTEAATPLEAMRSLATKGFRTHIAIEESAAALARKEATRSSVLLSDIASTTQAIWRNKIDRNFVRPIAEAYLTFGMYGPMNVLEDFVRSTLGGVFPRRMSNEAWEELSMGLLVDPETFRYGVSEMLGYLAREGSRENWNNWVLQLAMFGQKRWAEKVYTALVRRPGAVGMEVRRNFIGRKYVQVFGEMGGAQFEALTKAGPKNLPKLADRRIIKEIQAEIFRRKTTGNPDIVRAGKDLFTRKRVMRNEFRSILEQHPDLPNSIRDSLLRDFDDDVIFREAATSIDRVFGEKGGMLVDDFVRGPEAAALEYHHLGDFLTALDVTNPQEMASAIQAVYKMSEVYGALPEQIIAQATVRSRGLPLAERRAVIDPDFDRIYAFLDSAGADIDKVIAKLKIDVHNIAPGSYEEASTRLFNIMMAKREAAAEFRTLNMTSRHEIFARVTRREMKTTEFWDDIFYPQMQHEYRLHNLRQAELDGQLVQALTDVNIAAGAKPIARAPVVVTDRALAPNDIATLLGVRGDDISRGLLDVLTIQNNKDMFIAYVMGMTRPGDAGFTKEAVGAVYDQIAYSLRVSPESMSWISGKQMELENVRREMHSLYNSKLIPDNEAAAIGKYFDDMGDAVEKLMYKKGKLTSEYANFDELRQSAMDEAHKWYYKEYPDYTNANAFDAMMKSIYPYWTYESQRWFWLPRSFVRHPGTFTTFERWQNNSDYGYIHIPNTSVDVNPFRGTIYGTLTTRLTRRDFPEYYDSLGSAKGAIEVNDYLSRWGFYPGAHIGIPIAFFGGAEQQMGETIPAIWKTPLNALIALRPDDENVKFISDRIFSDRFRDYMTILEVNKRGYNGSHIWVKIKEGLDLTEEEQAIWDESRGEAALYGVGFEQFGLFRLRTDEQYKMYEASSAVIEEMTGYTPEQQDWLRRHGYRLWDMVGGLSPTNQAILQELDSYKWMGTITPLLPSRQQMELRRLDLDWDDVTRYTESTLQSKVQLQQEFLSGGLGPRDYNSRLQSFYSDQRAFVDRKIEENPNMTLEGRKEYYKRYGIPIPVQHPMRELLNLYFSVELEDKYDEETEELTTDWDSFFAQRGAIEDAIPEELKGEWEDYLARNTTRVEKLRREVSNKYFRKYYDVWEASMALYPEDEQRLINEYLYLKRTGQQLDRQTVIRDTISTKTGNKLISSFRSDASDNRAALRYANPHLDAQLFFWGRVTSFKTPQAEAVYRQLLKDVGRAG